jgi:HTH-type transcriptional repressor of NAD biosynthesis genes
MIRGIIIGKFLPVHAGHLALIDFASQQCDELIVSMSYKASDSIDAELRFSWLKSLTESNPKVRLRMVHDNFDNDHLELEARMRLWANVIDFNFDSIHRVFSSEDYGAPLAIQLKAEGVLFDRERKQVPVSASQIRKEPMKYWHFIPIVVRPYFVRKICFYGPESTGKSVLARNLASAFQTELVPEVAREIISSNDFTADDIIKIGHAQTRRVLEKLNTANRFLFCDTDVITTQIYSKHYLGLVPEVLYELEKKIHYDQYFLFDIDTPWVKDGMRDLGHRREEMMKVFRHELDRRKINYTLVRGDYEEREKIVVMKLTAM